MDKRDVATQTCSSARLETRFRNGLKTPQVQSKSSSIFILSRKPHQPPDDNLGGVRLEIRRVRGKIIVKCMKSYRKDPDDSGNDEINLDMVDGEREPPWIIFNFIFKNIAHRNSLPKASAARGMRPPPSDVSAGRDDDGIPSKPFSVSLASAWPRYLTDQSTSSSTSQAGPRCWRCHTVRFVGCGYFATRKGQAAPQEIIHCTFRIRLIFG